MIEMTKTDKEKRTADGIVQMIITEEQINDNIDYNTLVLYESNT